MVPHKPTIKDLEKAAEKLHNWNLTFLSFFGALAYYYYIVGRYSFVVQPGTKRYILVEQLNSVVLLVSLLIGLYITVRVIELNELAKKTGENPVKLWWKLLKSRVKQL